MSLLPLHVSGRNVERRNAGDSVVGNDVWIFISQGERTLLLIDILEQPDQFFTLQDSLY